MLSLDDQKFLCNTDFERAVIDVGGGDPKRVMDRQAYSDALTGFVEALDEHRPGLIGPLCRAILKTLSKEERRALEAKVEAEMTAGEDPSQNDSPLA